MNLIVVGEAFLVAMLSGPDAPMAPVEKAPVEAAISQPVQSPAPKRAPNVEPVQRTAQAPAVAPDDRGWMTREISVDQKTGETTEISVIGFAD